MEGHVLFPLTLAHKGPLLLTDGKSLFKASIISLLNHSNTVKQSSSTEPKFQTELLIRELFGSKTDADLDFALTHFISV